MFDSFILFFFAHFCLSKCKRYSQNVRQKKKNCNCAAVSVLSHSQLICYMYNTNLFVTQSVSVYSKIAIQFSDVKAKIKCLSKEEEKSNILFWREFHRIEWRKAECNAILFTIYLIQYYKKYNIHIYIIGLINISWVDFCFLFHSLHRFNCLFFKLSWMAFNGKNKKVN